MKRAMRRAACVWATGLLGALAGCASDTGSGQWVRAGGYTAAGAGAGAGASAAVAPTSGAAGGEATGSVESTMRLRVTESRAASALQEKVEAGGQGWLGDRSGLRPSPRHPTTMYEQSARLVSYAAFIVEPMECLAQQTVRGVAMDDAERTALAAALREETVRSLATVYSIVTEPGPGVATIRAAITGVAASRRDPVTGELRIGGASVEMEIVDSVTRERLAAAVEADIVDDAGEPDAADPFSDARLVFKHWAARLNLWLRDADRLATRP